MEKPVTLTYIRDEDVPPEILAAKDAGERILWVGKPGSAAAFALSSGGLGYALIGLFFLFGAYSVPALAILGMLFIGPMLMLLYQADNTWYAISDRRVILNTGVLNRHVSGIDYDQVGEVVVNACASERALKVGSVTFGGSGDGAYRGFVSIKEYNEIAALLKSVSVDVKTDWMYPNAKRPGENKGYRTTYCFAGEGKDPAHQP